MNARRSRFALVGILIVVWCAPAARGDEALDSAAFEAYQVGKNWVERGSVPEEVIAIQVKGVVGVHVTLRVQGVTVGQGGATIHELSRADEETDLMALVAVAMRVAFEGWRESRLEPGEVPILDLQVAYGLERLNLKTLEDLPRSIVPHAHGLAMESEGNWGWHYPGNAVAANTDLNDQLTRLMAVARVPLMERQNLGTAEGPSLFRFEALHITTPVRGGDPVRLYRGRETLPSEPPDDQMLALLGEQLADHLVAWQRDDGRFFGTYEPTPHLYSPPVSDAASIAYAAYALARSSRLEGMEAQKRAEAAQRAVAVLVESIGLPDVVGSQVIGRDAEPTAITLLALLETGYPGKEVRDRLVLALQGMIGVDGVCRTDDSEDAGPCTPETQSLVAAALTAAYDQTRDPAILAQARALCEAAWRSADPANEYRLLPWLLLAESRLAGLGVEVDQARCVALCERVWQRQVVPWGDAGRGAPPDTIGGFVVGEHLHAEPTYESAGVLFGMTHALRASGFVHDEERTRWLLGCGLASRFLNQLTFQAGGAYYTRAPSKAIGGLSVALWDNRQVLRPNAMALLAITELRLALKELGVEKPQ